TALLIIWAGSLRWSVIATGELAGRTGRLGIEGGTFDAHWVEPPESPGHFTIRPTSLWSYRRCPDWSPEEVGLIKCPECVWGTSSGPPWALTSATPPPRPTFTTVT